MEENKDEGAKNNDDGEDSDDRVSVNWVAEQPYEEMVYTFLEKMF